MTPIAIYARHSTDKQTHSTRDQIARCKKFCEKNNYEVAHIFSDEGVSGSAIINRPGIHDLIEGALCGYFQRVIAEDLSRFSRDQGDMAHFYKRMRFLDIPLETITEGEINELHIGLKGTMNALYIKDLGDKTHRGMIASVLAGGVPGGNTYGYDKVSKLDDRGEPIRGLRVINEAQAETVRSIFNQYATGNTLKKICENLNARDIPSPKGGRWAVTTLIGQVARKTGLLRQTLYKGEVTFNRMAFRKHPDTGKRISLIRPENEWLRVPIPELAIIDETLFDKVQQMIEERSSLRKERLLLNQVLEADEKAARDVERERKRRAQLNKPRKHACYIVSGRLHCDKHNESMINSRKKLYSCPVKGCENRNLRLERDLMPIVLKDMSRFDGAGFVDHIDALEIEREDLREEILEFENELDVLRGEIRNVLNQIAKGKSTEDTTSWLSDRDRSVRRLKYDIERRQKKLRAISALSDKETKAMVTKFHSALNPLITAYKADKFDQTATLKVHPWIKTFIISSKWNESKGAWDRSATTIYNWSTLFADLR